jgi:hypothetical protein
MNRPSTGSLREVVPLSDAMFHAFVAARSVYLLAWPSAEAPHRLVITALDDDAQRVFPSNYASIRAYVIIPPGLELLPQYQPEDIVSFDPPEAT